MEYMLLIVLAILLLYIFFNRGKFEHLLLLNKIIEHSDDGYWFYYVNSDKSWWSTQNYRLFGLDNYDVTKDKKFFPSLVHPDYYDKFIDSSIDRIREVLSILV